MRTPFAVLAVALLVPASADAQTRGARAAFDAQVRTDPVTGAVASVGRNDGLLTEPSDRTPEQVAVGYLREQRGVFGLGETDIANLKLVARSVSPDGITHLRYNQTLDGIESFDSGLIAHVTEDGRLISVAGKPQPGARLKETSPAVSALASLGAARRETGGVALPPRVTKAGRATTFATGEAARLRWIATAGGARLAWDVYTGSHSVVVDAESGDTLVTTELTDHAGQARYFPRDPARNPVPTQITMPPAWYDQHNGGTRLWGQYARTYIDETDHDPAPGAELDPALRQIPASSGTDWLYTRSTAFPGACPGGCSWTSPTRSTAVTNERQAATNVHVLTSRYLEHLASAPIGFDVASGSFRGNDYVQAEVNDGQGFNNANFTTQPNGTPSRMQMFLFGSDTNGSDVADIVYHEIGHGLSNRLIVNASGVGAVDGVQGSMMGEGWSDFYAIDLLEAEGWLTDTATPGELRVATHVVAGGIRNKPPDCPVAPAGLPGCNANGRAAITVLGGYTYGDLASTLNTSPHNGGELWTAVLWDLRKAVGRQAALALITGGMRLTPGFPTMLEARDAILRQAIAMRSGAGAADDYYERVWRVFMARGFGAAATTTGSSDATPVESYTEPANTLSPRTPTVADPYPGGDSDGRAEPGERVEISAPVFTGGLGDLAGVTGAISFDHPGVTVQTATAAWPLLGRARTAANAAPFVATLPASCATSPSFTVSLTGASGAGTVSAVIPFGPVSRRDVAINDAVAEDVAVHTEASWTVDSGATVSDVDIRIDELRHSYLGDLTITVTHAGETVRLLDRVDPAWSSADVVGAIFDSDAAAGPPSSGPGPLAGRMRPAEAAGLNRFDGKPAGGVWTLRISDFFPGDAGALRAWGADGSAFPCSRAEIPAAATGDAAGATVSGTVTPNGRATGLRFAYGTSPAYGSITAVQDAGAGDAPVAGSAELTGLAPGTTYHYRVEAIRESGVVAVAGADRTFTTPAAPAPTPTVSPVPARDGTAPSFTRKATVKLAKAGKKRRATFSFALSEPARVSAEVTVAAKGIRKGSRCVAVPKKKPKGARSCTRQVRAATGTAATGAGTLKIAKTLGKGAYTATLTATDAAGNRATATVRFTIR